MTEKLYRDPNWLNEMYWEQKKSTTEMAEIAGCSGPTIWKWMNKHGIPCRTLAEAARLKAQDSTWQRAHAEGIRRRSQDPAWRKATAEGIHRRSQDPAWRKATAEGMRRRSQDPAWQKAQAARNRRLAQDPTWRKAYTEAMCRVLQCLALKKRGQGEMTDIEAICHTAFDSLGLEFVFEKFIYPYRVDFFFPSHGVIVEALGAYWHKRPKRRKRDAERKQYLEASGYVVLEWWGPDIKADVWRLIEEELLPLLDQPSRMERPPRSIFRPYRGPHGWQSAVQLSLFDKEPNS